MKNILNTVLFGAFIFAVLSILMPDFAFAAGNSGGGVSSAGEVFDKLAGKAGTIGNGLRRAGFAIAGLGLIVFSFMAIFNKISWKNLAYIMASCFVLGSMALIIKYISDDQATNLDIITSGDTYKAEAVPGDAKSVPVTK